MSAERNPRHRGEPDLTQEAADRLTQKVRGNHPEFCLWVEGRHRAPGVAA